MSIVFTTGYGPNYSFLDFRQAATCKPQVDSP